jgi:hypothetical protein
MNWDSQLSVFLFGPFHKDTRLLLRPRARSRGKPIKGIFRCLGTARALCRSEHALPKW